MKRYRQRGQVTFEGLFIVFVMIVILGMILYPVFSRAEKKAKEAEKKARKSAPVIEITKEIPPDTKLIKLKSPSGKTTWVSVLD